MEQTTFNFRFTGILLMMGAVMVNLGFLLRPVQCPDVFTISAFLEAHNNESIWIWSFRILVFGLFIQVMGLEALRSLFRQSNAHTVVSPGIMVSILAMLVAAVSEAYYMHMGAWAGWKMSTLDASQQEPFLQTLEATHEWVLCISRMGYMFFCLGLVVTGWGFIRDNLFPKYLGVYALIYGVGGILFLLVFDDRTDLYTPVRLGGSIFLLLTGFLLIRKGK